MGRWHAQGCPLDSLALAPVSAVVRPPCAEPCPASAAWPLPAVDDFLRGIGFYRRVFQLVSSDDGSEEAAAEAAEAEGRAAAA